MKMPRSHDDEAQLVEAARLGEADAFTTLFQRWFDPCCDVSRRILRTEDLAAEVAQDTFLTAWKNLGTLRDPSAFGGWVLRMARNKSLNRLERERRSRPTEHDQPVLANLEAGDDTEGGVMAELTASQQQELVEAATAVLGEREASVLDLHLRFGMDAGELAEELGVTPNNAHQLLFRMRRKLGAGIRAWVLFSGGRPDCERLAAALGGAGITAFGRPAMKVVDTHVAECDECERRRAAALAPSAMFAGLPVVALSPAVRESVVSALRDQGVPLTEQAAMGAAAPASAAKAPTRPATRWVAVTAAAVVLAAVGLLTALSGGDDAPVEVASETADRPTTTEATTTTTTAPATTVAEATTTAAPTTTIGSLPAAPAPGDAPSQAQLPPMPAPQIAAPQTTSPPAPAPPASSAPPVQTPQQTTTTVPPPPVVDYYTASPGVGTCTNPPFPTTLSWDTTGATSVAISGLGSFGPSGSVVRCTITPSNSQPALTATGPGGTTGPVYP